MEDKRNDSKDPASQEREFYFFIVDLFAREYGWPVEYIQDLELPEIAGLLNAMKRRKNNEDIINQLNINKGFSGKLSVNREGTPEEKKKDEVKNLHKLAELLGQKVKKVDNSDG